MHILGWFRKNISKELFDLVNDIIIKRVHFTYWTVDCATGPAVSEAVIPYNSLFLTVLFWHQQAAPKLAGEGKGQRQQTSTMVASSSFISFWGL